jgi:hypothetical protein
MSSAMGMPKDNVNILKGQARYYDVVGESGKIVSRGFCANCGFPLFIKLESSPALLGIKAGSLEDPDQFKPTMNIYMSSAPKWAQMAEGLQKFQKRPG